MEDFFWLIFFVIFIVGPILERIRKGGAGKQPPQRPLPRQPPARQRVPQRPRDVPQPRPVEASGHSDEESAVDILPSDLWEMLTGQRPSHSEPMSTGPRHAPEPMIEAEPEETIVTRPVPQPRDERAEVDRLMDRRSREFEKARSFQREEPTIVSLESTLLPEPKRHAAFHRKLDEQLAPPPDVKTAKPAFRLDLMGRSELQRAILLREILGRPIGLE